ncbi:MAG: CotH kinase family protein [Fibrobacteria bacterium]|nr:CotH kinase family protein [Fibrobacteria bacterium]
MNTRMLLVLASVVAVGFSACDDSKPLASPPEQGPGPDAWLPDSLDTTGLVLEEIVPGNVDFLDERGEDPGWVEISNVSDTSIPLGAWRLRGEEKDGPGWRLPDTLLAPGQRVLVFLSGLDRRRMSPAGDSVEVSYPKGYGWSDSLNDPPGHSTYGPWEMKRLGGVLMPESLLAVSATMTLADPAGTELDWSVVNVNMNARNAPVDASGRDHMLMRATIPEGQPLVLRFYEEGQDSWKGATLEIVGTGKRLDTYDISLLGLPTDFGHFQGVVFEAPTGRFGTYHFTVVSMKIYRSQVRAHANFQLHRKGGVLHLEDTAGVRRQTVAYPEMPTTASWSRIPGTRRFVQRETPTPEAPNSSAPEVWNLPAPAFATAPGFHAGPVRVRLGAVPGATLRCALDGQRVGPGSPDAREGILLDSTRSLTCAAFGPDGRQGPSSTALFLVNEKVTLPVMSVVVDSLEMFDTLTGLYQTGPNASTQLPYYGANFWEDRELPGHVQFFEKDGREAFSAPAGVGIYGNWSRAAPKKSLSIQFREKYGVRRIEWPLFPQHPEFTRFKGFGLRNNGGNFGKDYVRDALASSLTEGLDLEYQLSRHVIVFLNGRYWGIHNLREKLDADYLDTRFGLSGDQIDLLKNGGEVQAGSATGWSQMVQWFHTADLAREADAAKARQLLDVDNYANYLAAEMWASNCDWPANNLRSWRRWDVASPWRMMLFDLDGGLSSFCGDEDMFAFLGDSSVVDEYPNGPDATVFFRRLSGDPAWRTRFVNRFAVLLSRNFSPARSLQVLDSMTAVLAPEIDRDRARWGLSAASQEREDKKLRTFLSQRAGLVRQNMEAWYGLADTATVKLEASGGRLKLEGLDVGSSYQGIHYPGLGFQVEAVPDPGREFTGWSDGETSARRTIAPTTEGLELTAIFR